MTSQDPTVVRENSNANNLCRVRRSEELRVAVVARGWTARIITICAALALLLIVLHRLMK